MRLQPLECSRDDAYAKTNLQSAGDFDHEFSCLTDSLLYSVRCGLYLALSPESRVTTEFEIPNVPTQPAGTSSCHLPATTHLM